MKIERTLILQKSIKWGLNPYSNGMKIELRKRTQLSPTLCLNPYSNGMKIEYVFLKEYILF